MKSDAHVFYAPAKLNLMLRVVGQRQDGYHFIETVFRLVDFGDTIHIAVREDGAIQRSSELPGVLPEHDLVIRAARLLQQYSGTHLGAGIAVEKCIPMGGGLGGGSSDAATVLMALNYLWNIGLPRETLMQLGVNLGADVPFFIFGRNAFATGIGEQLSELLLPERWYAVFTPGITVSSREIFTSPLLTYEAKPSRIPLLNNGIRRCNDLQKVVCSHYPAVSKLIDTLEKYGYPLMTGSGSCVFLEYETEQKAKSVFSQLSNQYQGFVCRGLSTHPMYRVT